MCGQAGQACDDGNADEAQRSAAFHVRMRRWLPAALALYLSAGCGPAPTMTAASLTIVPTSSSADQPVDVLGSGLTSGQPMQLSMTSTDVHGVMWSSKAIFRPDAAGRLDLAKDAPQSGSYSGASGSGLLWSMRPNTGTTPYFWGPKPMTFTVQRRSAGRRWRASASCAVSLPTGFPLRWNHYRRGDLSALTTHRLPIPAFGAQR